MLGSLPFFATDVGYVAAVGAVLLSVKLAIDVVALGIPSRRRKSA